MSDSANSAAHEVKEKRVELIELFYDLIYVYAISRMTLLLEEPEGGVLSLLQFASYIGVSCTIIQAWLYMTNYVNRYGTWRWWEYALTGVNMIAVIYMVSTISLASEWDGLAAPFDSAMIVALGCVALQYIIQIRSRCQDIGAARNSRTVLAIVISLYAIALAVSFTGDHASIVTAEFVAVIAGMFLPFLIRGSFDARIISFPHLVERFELLTIITFGEAVVALMGFFDMGGSPADPALAITAMIVWFGCYVLQIHVLADHHRVSRSLRLMFTHYFIVISINLVTAALILLGNAHADRLFVICMAAGAIALFYISIYLNSAYYPSEVSFEMRDALASAAAFAAGCAIMVVLRESVTGVLAGSLVIACGNFAMLLCKRRRLAATGR